jgi:hypothetical protein
MMLQKLVKNGVLTSRIDRNKAARVDFWVYSGILVITSIVIPSLMTRRSLPAGTRTHCIEQAKADGMKERNSLGSVISNQR